MCIIVHKPEGIKLDPIVYRNCWNRNDHGGGIAYVHENKLVIKKGIKTISKFLDYIKAVEDKELIIHCRLASKGEISDSNCHPFRLKSKLHPEQEFAIMHNGTLNWRSTKEKSDTAHFVEDFLQPLLDRDPWFFDFHMNMSMMGAFITLGNKLCIMRHDSKSPETSVEIINKGEGIMYKKCWFSNLSFTDDNFRHVVEADRKRIESWEPKEWEEPPVFTQAHGMGGYQGNLHLSGPTGGANPSQRDGSTRGSLGAIADWGWADGFGFYSKDPAYDGSKNGRSLAHYNRWVNALKKEGKSPPPLPSGEEIDDLKYLTDKEVNVARKESVAMIKELFGDDFDFKGMTTAEIVAWARAELRSAFPDFEGIDNKKLTAIIMTGSCKLSMAADSQSPNE